MIYQTYIYIENKKVINTKNRLPIKMKEIDECDVAPVGCNVLGDLPGMGPIEFPHDGKPGSGDIPMPSGKLYYQVQPFDSFVKDPHWKKRKKMKKKKNTPDSEIYKHSPNPSVYKYVYDFKTYMEKAKD
jgi:hypothetical protein